MSAPQAIRRAPESFGLWQMTVLVTSLVVLAFLLLLYAAPLPPEVSAVLNVADMVACAIFLVDFILQLRAAPDRRRYFLTYGWIDLLSSIPAIDIFRMGRLLRLIRLLRLVRAIRVFTHAWAAAKRDRAGGTATGVGLTLFLVLFLGASLILFAEHGAGNIRTASDALWWAASTISTVGYGDHYPVSDFGRLVAVVLMVTGVATFSTMTALISSWVVAGQRRAAGADGADARRILERIDALHTRIDALERALRR